MRPALPVTALLFALLSAGPSLAGPCDSALPPRQSSLRDSLTNFLQITQTFRVTLQNGLTARPFAEISERLLSYGCWLIRTDTTLSYNKLALGIAQRFRTLESDSTFSPDTTMLPAAGESAAPVSVVGFVSMSCSHCRQVIPELYHEVAFGGLKGKARLYIRTAMPSLGDRSLYAAQKCGRFWEYLVVLAGTSGDFDKQETLVKVAKQAGLSAKDFKKALDDTAVAGLCMRSFNESQRLGANSTPAFFIDGRRYTSIPYTQWVVDAADYAFQTAARRVTTRSPAAVPGARAPVVPAVVPAAGR